MYTKKKNEKSLQLLLQETDNPDFVQAMRYFKEADRHFCRMHWRESELMVELRAMWSTNLVFPNKNPLVKRKILTKLRIGGYYEYV